MSLLSTFIVRLLQNYWRTTRGLTLASQACVVDPAGKLLLTAPAGRADAQILPRTFVRRGESAADAALRLLQEDLAIVPTAEPELLAILPSSAPDGGGQIATFLIRSWTGRPAATAAARSVAFVAAADLPASLDDETKHRILTALSRSAPGQM